MGAYPYYCAGQGGSTGGSRACRPTILWMASTTRIRRVNRPEGLTMQKLEEAPIVSYSPGPYYSMGIRPSFVETYV